MNGEVIVGELNEVYPLRVLEAGRPEGTNAVYRVELMGGVLTGMPGSELQYGKRFSIDYAPVERELSRPVSDIRFTAPVAMRNEFSVIRKQHKVPGNKLGLKLACGIPFVDRQTGKNVVQNMWMHNVEWEFEQQFQEDKDNLIMYGRSNRNRNAEYLNIGQSGNVIKMGDGLRAQMGVANVIYYNDFDLEVINRALYALSAAKLGLNDRVFVLRTGEAGAAQFSQAVQRITSGWTQFVIDNYSTHVVKQTKSELHDNALSAGFQFVEYKAPNGVTVKVEVDPLYDNPIRNKLLLNGRPAESYRYDILYLGSMDQPNIQLAKVRGQHDIRGYEFGLRNPFTGQIGNGNMSFGEDSAVVHGMWTGGVFILDPTRTVSIIPAVLA